MDQANDSSPEHEAVWEDFRKARKTGDLDGMERALARFRAIPKPDPVPRFFYQKQGARRSAMERTIEPLAKQRQRAAEAPDCEGSW